MRRIRHSPEQIIRKLREADAELAEGAAIPEICKASASPRTPTTAGGTDSAGSRPTR